MGALDERDRALASRLVLGSVAAEGELDRVIDSHLRRGAKLEPRVRDALRLAVFEVLYLDTPDFVAASQGVELVRTVAPRAAGLANAVLRRVADEDVARLAASREALARGRFSVYDMAHVGGLPIWLCEAALAPSARGRRLLCRGRARARAAYRGGKPLQAQRGRGRRTAQGGRLRPGFRRAAGKHPARPHGTARPLGPG